MVSFGTIPSMIGITGTALLVPMLFLLLRGTSDPEGVVDGLVRLCWLMPLVWLAGVALESKGKLGTFKGIMQLHAPLIVSLTLVSFFMLGWRNDGVEIVFRPDRSEVVPRSTQQEPRARARLPLVGALGHWAHNTLPPHPFPFGGDRE